MTQRRIAPPGAASRLALISAPMVAGCLLAPSTVHGQEALRTAVEGDRSYQNRRQQAIESPMPMFWGPVGFSVGAGVRTTYDDNTLLTEDNAQEDVIISPGVNLGVYYPITDRTRLNFGFGLAYDIYTQHTREDQFSLTPNSALALDFEVGRALVTVSDTFSYSQDLLSQGEVSNTRNYGGFSNTAGVRVFWVPEPLLVEGGYSWNMFLSSDEEFSELDRNSHQVFFRLGQVLEERTRWGVETTGSQTMFDTGERNDFTSLSVGPYLEWQVTDAVNLSLRGGWTWSIFDDNGLTPTPDDVSVPYLGLQASHQLTASFNHNLSVAREVRVGVETDYIETFIVRYGFVWQVTDLISPNAGIYYEVGEQPGFPVAEKFDRVGFDVGLPFRLTDHLGFSLGYQFTIRDSDAVGRDYSNNRISADFRYQF